ncbi:DMT family transporter [Neisseria lisongii]|uniref:DMT family transporter n=1 Tax=Neisseria lisongii TaxID=2912188 RepID=A0AAW5AE64_9NEIS|nr:DMT family transporter [Neisseria lisongii]MCF7529350.1 DMT family transporter [Neisseria lisongii]
MNRQTLGMLQIIAAAVCWGALGFFGTMLNRAGFDGIQIAMLRILIAALILLAAFPHFRPLLRSINRRQVPVLVAQSLIGVLGMSLLYFIAITRVGSALAVALLYTSPAWSLLFSRILLGEAITPKAALLTAVAVGGVALTMSGGIRLDLLGIIIGLGSGICYALYGVLGKAAMSGVQPMAVLFTSIVVSGLVLLPFPATHQTFRQLAAAEPHIWLTAVSLSFIGTLSAFTLFIKGLEKMPAARAAVFTVIEPFTAVLLAATLLGEQLSLPQYLGVLLIIAAAAMNAGGRRKPSVAAQGKAV